MSLRDIGLDDAEPGMILGADLTDGQGSVLLPAGVALSAANLASLRRRGIAGALVVVDDEADATAGAAPPADDTAEQERRQARLVRLFRDSAGVGASALLLQLLQDYRRGG